MSQILEAAEMVSMLMTMSKEELETLVEKLRANVWESEAFEEVIREVIAERFPEKPEDAVDLNNPPYAEQRP